MVILLKDNYYHRRIFELAARTFVRVTSHRVYILYFAKGVPFLSDSFAQLELCKHCGFWIL